MDNEHAQPISRLIKGLYRRRLADLVLATLAEAHEPCRQADLKLALATKSGSFVHHRTFSNAMSYLEAYGLVVRRDVRPGVVLYEIADLGRVVHAQLTAVEQSVHEHNPEGDARQCSTGGGHPSEE